MFQRCIAGSGKIIDPPKVINLGACGFSNLDRAIAGPGTHYKNLRLQIGENRQETGELLLFIAHNHED